MATKNKPKNQTIALHRKEKRINNEADREMQQYWEDQGLKRKFPHELMDENFWYNCVATTEQRGELDSAVKIIESPPFRISGAYQQRFISHKFEDCMDQYLGI